MVFGIMSFPWCRPQERLAQISLYDFGYGKDSLRFFANRQVYCRNTVTGVLKIGRAFLFRDLNLISPSYATVFQSTSGNALLKHSCDSVPLSEQCQEESFLKDFWYYHWDQSGFKCSRLISDKCSISGTTCEVRLCDRPSPELSATWIIALTASMVVVLLWPLLLQISNLRTENFLPKWMLFIKMKL